MNIKIVKKIEEANCITHAGTFHADEIFATIILSKIMAEIKLIRVLKVEEEKYPSSIVYDIGGGKYDHHQFGGNGQRSNGIKYAACGLIWKEYGKKLLEKYDIDDADYTWEYIDKNLIQFIDSNDNGQLPKLDAEYRNVHLAYIISIFNPRWNEQKNSDEQFLKALNLSEIVFDEFIYDTISKMKAKKHVDLAIEESNDGIMYLKESMPWKEFLLSSNNLKAKDINYVIFPSNRGGYTIYAVPVEIGSFENRKSFPKEWRGLIDKKLQDVTDVKTARFCHNAGFICTAETLEDATKLAKKANMS